MEAIYGVLVGIAGVLLGMFLDGVSSYSDQAAHRERVLDRRPRRPRQRLRALIAAYVVDYLETVTAYT